jgi:pimeloyl-ACP methyl ester carboxylesterase
MARAPDGDGRLRKFKADASQLATVMFGSAPAYATVRELDAAARAYAQGDRVPLLRLMAESQVDVDSRDETRSPVIFSAGLAAAVTCGDAPQIFDMRLDPVRRRANRDEAIARRKSLGAGTYAPFTIDEYRGMPIDYAFIDLCASWPAVEPKRYLAMADLRNAPYPNVPALVISGDLDNMTPLADGTLVAKRFPRGRQLVVPNGFHVNALPHSRSACPAEIARRFIATLEVGDTRCLSSIPEVRLVPAFARQVQELPPARSTGANRLTQLQLQMVTGAVMTVGDAIARIGSNTTGRGVGLRGGAFDVAPRAEEIGLTLYEVRWAEDLGVSGKVVRPLHNGTATAEVAVIGPGGNKGTLRIRWTEGVRQARAEVSGELADVPVVAETAAP